MTSRNNEITRTDIKYTEDLRERKLIEKSILLQQVLYDLYYLLRSSSVQQQKINIACYLDTACGDCRR